MEDERGDLRVDALAAGSGSGPGGASHRSHLHAVIDGGLAGLTPSQYREKRRRMRHG